MNNNIITIYTDGSYQKINKNNYLGVGIFIIHPDLSDMKIAFCKQTNEKTKIGSSYAEILSALKMLDYINKNNYYEDKEIYLYSDSEYVVNIINDCEKHKSFYMSKKYIKIIKNHNIKSFWIKGHRKEKGNIIVDSLAYNIIHHYIEKKVNSLQFLNTPLINIFNPVLRTSNYFSIQEDYWEFNKESHQRYKDKENNNMKKSESAFFRNKIFFTKNNDLEWSVFFEKNEQEDSFSLLSENECDCNNLYDLTLSEVIKKVNENISYISQTKENKKDILKINIYFNDNNIVNQINNIIEKVTYLKKNGFGMELNNLINQNLLYKVILSLLKSLRNINILSFDY